MGKKGENMEENDELLKAQNEKIEADKRLLKIEVVLELVSIISFLIIFGVSFYAIIELKIYVVPIILIIVSFALFIVATAFAFYIEQVAGYYECDKCHHKYIPTYKQSVLAPHMGRTKYMKCPKCQQKSWNKKVLK